MLCHHIRLRYVQISVHHLFQPNPEPSKTRLRQGAPRLMIDAGEAVANFTCAMLPATQLIPHDYAHDHCK